jgi:hypothetical protein
MKNHTNLLEDVSKELVFILNIIDERESQIIPKDLNWTLFISLVTHHRLFSYIYMRLKKVDVMVPDHVMKTLESLYKQSIYKMLHLTGEMLSLHKLFVKETIPLIILKGPVLAQDLYGDISLRTCSDLDVLIPLCKLQQAEEVLKNQGYVKDEYIKSVLNDWKWRHHHVTYFHAEKGAKVEIHWRLNPGPSKEPTFTELWNRKRLCSITNQTVYILGKEDLFFFLVTHGARHAWSRLRWLFDIHLLLKHNLDFREVKKLFTENHFRPSLSQSLQLCKQLLNSPLTPELEKIANNGRGVQLAKSTVFYFLQMVNLHNEPVPKSISQYHKKYIISIMSWQQKCLYTISLLHPNPDDIEILLLPKRLHILYFPLKPFLWLRRKMEKYKILT